MAFQIQTLVMLTFQISICFSAFNALLRKHVDSYTTLIVLQHVLECRIKKVSDAGGQGGVAKFPIR